MSETQKSIRTYSEEVVTPEMAKKWLDTMVTNRPLKQWAVNSYADAIINGKFRTNGEFIKFDWNGNLCDGQHRLSAIVKANRPVLMCIARNCDPADFVTYDSGVNRKPADLISLNSRYYAQVGPLITSYLKFKKNRVTIDGNNDSYRRLNITNEEVYNEYMSRTFYWDRAAQNLKRWRNRNNKLIPSFTVLYAGTFYLEDKGFSREKMDEFFETLTDFNITNNLTITTVRQYLVKEMGNRIGRSASDDKNVVTAKILHGLKNYLAGNNNISRVRVLVNKSNISVADIFNLR